VHDATPAQIIRAVMLHADEAPLTDDLTVLALRCMGAGSRESR